MGFFKRPGSNAQTAVSEFDRDHRFHLFFFVVCHDGNFMRSMQQIRKRFAPHDLALLDKYRMEGIDHFG
jgi:hypothetical protein